MTTSSPLALTTLPFTHLDIPPQPSSIQHSLEEGNVLYLPNLDFSLTAEERELLNTDLVSPKRKNISYQPQKREIKGVADAAKAPAVLQLTERYYQSTLRLIDALLPGYREALYRPQTSLRLHPITACTSTLFRRARSMAIAFCAYFATSIRTVSRVCGAPANILKRSLRASCRR